MKRFVTACMGLALCSAMARSQEAGSGFDLHGTLTGLANYSRDLTERPRDGGPFAAGVRAVLYPVWKIDGNWSFSGAVQIYTRPFFYEEFATQGYGVLTNVLQAQLTYSRVREGRSLVVRAGILPSAFGSFLLRYDDALNPLIGAPPSYGYYGQGITLDGLAGVEVDAAAGKWDARAQFVNSSPANRRSIFDRDQYGAWAGGVGYTITQGFRVGVAGYRGPYLDRQSPYYFPGEARPRDLPGTALGLEAQWGRGPWSVYGEAQKFVFDYHVIPTFREDSAYGELRRTLTPRWYVAARLSYLRANVFPMYEVYETAVGFRTNRYQLIKAGYRIERTTASHGALDNAFAVELVTSFRAMSIAR